MTYISVNIPDEKISGFKSYVKKIGGELQPQNNPDKLKKPKIKSNVPFNYLFGKWPDFELDARGVRKKTWSHNK